MELRLNTINITPGIVIAGCVVVWVLCVGDVGDFSGLELLRGLRITGRLPAASQQLWTAGDQTFAGAGYLGGFHTVFLAGCTLAPVLTFLSAMTLCNEVPHGLMPCHLSNEMSGLGIKTVH